MAITARTVSAVQVWSATPSTDFVVPKPTGLTVGDVMVACMTTNGVAINLPAGWTSLHSLTASGNPRQRVFYKVADASDVAATNFTFTAATATYGSAEIETYVGVDPTAPIDFTCTPYDSAVAANSYVVPSGTVVTDGAVLIGGASANASIASTTFTVPAGWTSRWNPANGDGGAVAAAGGKSHLRAHNLTPLVAAAATGSTTWDRTSSVAGSAWVVGLRPAGAGATPTSRWVGATTPDGATVVAKATAGDNVRIKVATNAGLTSGVIYSSTVVADAQGYAKCTISGLSADTSYFYGVEVAGNINSAKNGRFRTLPLEGAQASFSFAFGSCMSSAQDTDSMSRIQAKNPLLFLQVGDLHYDDNNVNDQALYRASIEQQLAQSSIASLFANVATDYTWSDHDFSGNNSYGSSAGKPAAQAVYRQLVPHRTLPVADSIQRTFVVGRVRFIFTDERSFKSNPANSDNGAKTMLGATQKTWFKDLITSATEKVIFWVGDTPWAGSAVAGDDSWSGYTTERAELGTHIATSGKNVIRLAGDMHAIAADDGSNSVGSIPILHAAALNRSASRKGGPYSQGVFPASGSSTVRQYGYVQVTDTGSAVQVAFTGYDTADVAQVTWSKSYATPGGGGPVLIEKLATVRVLRPA